MKILHIVKDRQSGHTTYCAQPSISGEFIGLGWHANYPDYYDKVPDVGMCQACVGTVPDLDFLGAVDWEGTL